MIDLLATGAEGGHDPVTDEFLEECVESLDHAAQGPEQIGLQGTHILGIELLRDRREAGDIGEEDGDLLALTLHRPARGEDLLGEVLGRIGLRRGKALGRRRRC